MQNRGDYGCWRASAQGIDFKTATSDAQQGDQEWERLHSVALTGVYTRNRRHVLWVALFRQNRHEGGTGGEVTGRSGQRSQTIRNPKRLRLSERACSPWCRRRCGSVLHLGESELTCLRLATFNARFNEERTNQAGWLSLSLAARLVCQTARQPATQSKSSQQVLCVSSHA